MGFASLGIHVEPKIHEVILADRQVQPVLRLKELGFRFCTADYIYLELG